MKITDSAVKLKNTIYDILSKYNLIFLLIIFAVFLFSRLFRLDMIPAGIHYDEAGMAFDAKTLAMYGRDRHNNSFPLYLPAYGGGQSAMYAYLLAFLLKLVPFSMLVMRLPAVICGCIAFFSTYFAVKELLNDKVWGLMGAVLVTITPYFFTSERWALDCNLFLSIAAFSFLMLMLAIKNSSYKSYIIAGIALGLTLYTYVLSYIVLPIFLALTVIYLFIIKRLEIKKWICLAIPLGVLALPLLLMQLINMGKLKPFSFLIFDFPKLGFYRGEEMGLKYIPQNISALWMMLVHGEQFSFTSIPKFGPVYIVMIPLIIGGLIISIAELYRSIKAKEYTPYSLIVLFVIAGNLMVMMINDKLNIYTGNELYFAYALCIAAAMKWLNDRTWLITPVTLCVFAVCFLMFSNYYFRHYNEEFGIQYMFVSTEYGDVVSYTNEVYNPEHKKIYYLRAPEHLMYGDVLVGMALCADPAYWEQNAQNNTVENVYMGFPENDFDLNEDCLYIMSKETYGHIISYFIEQGFNYDESFPSYTIIYK